MSRPGLVIDLTETTFMDSTVVHLLLNAHQVLEARGHELIVQVTEASAVLRVLQLTQLDTLSASHETVTRRSRAPTDEPVLYGHLAALPSPATQHDGELAIADLADPARG